MGTHVVMEACLLVIHILHLDPQTIKISQPPVTMPQDATKRSNTMKFTFES